MMYHLDGKHLPPFDGRGMRATRNAMEQKRVEDARQALEEAQLRSTLRMQHTRPPPSTVQVSSYTIVPMEERPRSQQSQEQQQNDRPATLEDLCGIHAKDASKEHSNNYLQRDALGPKSRVMITGILNPIGFHLALALHEKCGVQVMTGIDYMFPNTVSHRLALQKRIQLLTSNIPKLVQPIVLPLVGLDPRRNKNLKNEPSVPFHNSRIEFAQFSTHAYCALGIVYSRRIHGSAKVLELCFSLRHGNTQCGTVQDSIQSRVHGTNFGQYCKCQTTTRMHTTPRPHLVYASSMKDHHDAVHASLKTADELLADTYHSLEQVYSVGVRLPNAVYGPWGRPGSTMYQLSDAAVANWNSATTDSRKLLESAGLGDAFDRVGDFLYVSGTYSKEVSCVEFHVPCRLLVFHFIFHTLKTRSMPLLQPCSFVPSLNHQSCLRYNRKAECHCRLTASAALGFMQSQSESAIESVEITESPLVQQTESFLKWKASTSFQEGMMKMLAWHLDNEPPTAQHDDSNALSSTCAGDVFLKQQGAEPCAADDVLCLSGRKVLPCVSECATSANCVSSVFDEVVELTKEVTEQCDYVLYTQSLGYNVKDLKLQAKYDDAGEQIVCNFAFLPRESALVDSVIKKVPDQQLEKFGISPSTTTKRSVLREQKRNGLNGRLLYKGWILIWVKGATTPLPTSDKSLLKLNPGNFFSSDVKKALFVDENFPVSPNLEDVLFLMGEVHRDKLPGRSVYHKDKDGKKHKYKLQPEPERKAVMLLAPLKQRVSHDSKETALADGQKLTVYTATKYMRYEIGEDANLKEAPARKKQREFYERVPTFLNRVDMRSPEEPWYRYEMKHWIRTRWIVHDMKLEEGRELRCDWFEEHVQWGNDLDQLSFAHVMARRELERRIEHQEPDDHIKPPHVQHPELKLLTDAHEWHPIPWKGASTR